MTHKPILHIYQHGDQFFAALPNFADLQEGPKVQVSAPQMRELVDMLSAQAETWTSVYDRIEVKSQATSIDKDAIFERAKLNSEHPGRWNERKDFVVKEERGE